MMIYKTPNSNEETAVYLKTAAYRNGNISLQLYDAQEHYPYATCTVNHDSLEEGEVAIKNYSENEGMLNFLLLEELVESPHRHIQSGFVKIPVCRLK